MNIERSGKEITIVLASVLFACLFVLLCFAFIHCDNIHDIFREERFILAHGFSPGPAHSAVSGSW
jgi:hypothetical protein